MSMRTRWAIRLGAVLAAGLPAGGAAVAAEADATARQLLKATGFEGGVIVHVGCGDGELTAALAGGKARLVDGLTRDAASVAAARRRLHDAGVAGKATVQHWTGKRLPYVDNFVNLLVADVGLDVPGAEVLRVLAPEGVAYVRDGGGWKKTVKPVPAETDEWTHFLYDPTNNAVSHDKAIQPLRHLQWIGRPRYSRHHDHMSSVSAMVSSGGRIFYIFDHANPLSIQLPSRWQLVARDAYNGAVLWRRDIPEWETQLVRLKSGPADLPRRLVAKGDTVYATLGYGTPVTALDAATGETVHTYTGTEGTDEILLAGGELLLTASLPGKPGGNEDRARRILAVDAESGSARWEVTRPWVGKVTLTADEKRVLFFDGERVVCLDRGTGKERWRSEQLAKRTVLPTYFGSTLVIHDGVVLFAGGDNSGKGYHRDHGKEITALDAATGKTLWQAPHPPGGYRSSEDIFVIDGTVWFGDIMHARPMKSEGEVTGLDLATGKVKARFKPDVPKTTYWFHHRCYRAKATENYLLTSRTGIEFVDFRNEHWILHHWVRGPCLYGIMPANGMIYNGPHPCACYLEAKLFGFNALAPASPSRQVTEPEPGRHRPGEAKVAAAPEPAEGDWPTLRGDAERSGRCVTGAPTALAEAWKAKLGGRLSAPVIAGGRVLVARIDAHAVACLDAATGDPRWTYLAGGRVDSPPTVWRGRALFGSADGWVTCLRLSDGAVCWRFRAAPAAMRLGADEQVESAWPVHGTVLVRPGKSAGEAEVWCLAGRSMYLDGGLRLLRLDAATGRPIAERVLDDRDPEAGKGRGLQVRHRGLNMPVALPDVLVDDGTWVYMRSQKFTPEGTRQELDVPIQAQRMQKGQGQHLFSPTGLLDDAWWHRSYWIYGRVWKSGAGGYYQAGRFAPAGRPMVFDEDTVYSFGRKPMYYRWTTPMEYHLHAAPKDVKVKRLGKRKPGFGAMRKPTERIETTWSLDVPILVRAMVLADPPEADGVIYLAGPPDLIDEPATVRSFKEPATQKRLAAQAAALEGAEGGLLWAVSTAGEKLAERKLDAVPTFDGLAAAGGKLYMTTLDGRVLCLGGK